ncbi:hypothetical protein ABXY50_005333 [Escherichia coli]
MTPILDSMAVLAAAAGKGCDENGIIKLADKTWLDNSIFKNVRVRHNCGSYDDFVIREGRGFYAFIDEHGRNVTRWEDPDSVFYFSNEQVVQGRKCKPTAFYSDPLNGCGVTVKTLWLNLYYLIDMAAAELAKEINNIPTHDQAGKHYSKKERLNRFHDVIEKRAIPFILDELPRHMELLAHPLIDIIRLMEKELQTVYQLMFLLTDNKAGVGNGSFMWHLNIMRQGRNYLYIPHSDAIGDIAAVIFNFPLGDCLSLGSGDDWVYWLGDDNIVYEESFDDAPDYYLFRNISELMEANKLMPLRFDCRWQYLSIGQHRLNTTEIMQDALTYGLKGLAEESFINKTFAKEVCKKGVASAYWDGIFYPKV